MARSPVLNTTLIRQLARLGAERRMAALQEEIEGICRTFPELRSRGKAPTYRMPPNELAALGGSEVRDTGTTRRRAMSATQRRAMSARMKKRWAAAKRAGKSRL
jgi:hypothetical protein